MTAAPSFELPAGRRLRVLEESDVTELHALIEANRAYLARWMPWAATQSAAHAVDSGARKLDRRRVLRLVDGMNVIGSRPDGWWRDRHAAMVRLVDQLERWATDNDERVAVVFERPPSPPIPSTAIEVAAAPRPGRDSADDEIVRRVSADPRPGEIRVVTSDQGLAARVRAAGATVEPARAFRRQLDEL
ncbi:MAG TPA: NYN domain-containing protein [Solirubrobacteraceae bacterium]|jgi:predicted RNA-binding protein with PIN domain|nr:NYN domain-containing protein [Solirubrobacteraceae bacterium]